MAVATARGPFNDPAWYFEPKWDGIRSLAYVDGGHCRLVSKTGYVYRSWPRLAAELTSALRCRSAVLDGELVCVGADGQSHLDHLVLGRDSPYFMAFDLLWLDGADLRGLKLKDRKRLLAGIMPLIESCVRFVEHVPGRGIDFFDTACRHNLEGIVAKWKDGTYQNGAGTTWLTIRNRRYFHSEGRVNCSRPETMPIIACHPSGQSWRCLRDDS
jgi:bifunctional non-homologous end joining protein LigD